MEPQKEKCLKISYPEESGSSSVSVMNLLLSGTSTHPGCRHKIMFPLLEISADKCSIQTWRRLPSEKVRERFLSIGDADFRALFQPGGTTDKLAMICVSVQLNKVLSRNDA